MGILAYEEGGCPRRDIPDPFTSAAGSTAELVLLTTAESSQESADGTRFVGFRELGGELRGCAHESGDRVEGGELVGAERQRRRGHQRAELLDHTGARDGRDDGRLALQAG
jgi:hypothetical protein